MPTSSETLRISPRVAPEQATLVSQWRERLATWSTRPGAGEGVVALPESGDPRVLEAAKAIAATDGVRPVLIGRPDEVADAYRIQHGHLPEFEIIDPLARVEENSRELIDRYHRRGRVLAEHEAESLAMDTLHVAALLVARGDTDAAVAGSVRTTGDVIRSGIRVIGTAPDVSTVSSCVLLQHKDAILAFGDCGVVPEPTAEQLADIALSTAKTFRSLTTLMARVAFLSFSTRGSAEHDSVTRVRRATQIAREMDPALIVDGELQFDAAVDPGVAWRKAPDSPVEGRANVFIFPNLDAANISYKIAERMGGARAFGPLLQGLARPVNDLSRGCSSADIEAVSLASILQARDSGGEGSGLGERTLGEDSGLGERTLGESSGLGEGSGVHGQPVLASERQAKRDEGRS